MLLIFDVRVKQQESHLFEVINWAPKKGQGGNYKLVPSASCDRLGEAGLLGRK